MNRRSFLKSAALAAVAVPVVGLPAMPVAKAVAVPVKTSMYRVQWEFTSSRGEMRTPELEHALAYARSLFCEWLNEGYRNSSNDIPSIRLTKEREAG